VRRVVGVNTWVWTSPLTDDRLPELTQRVAAMGFGAIELPLEDLGDWDAGRAAELMADRGLSPIVVAAMGPSRSLVARAGDVAATVRYLRGCIRAAEVVGSSVVAGPIYGPTGATWRIGPNDRRDLVDELRANLAPLVAEARDAGVALAIEPLNRYETSLLNTVEQALDALGPLIGPALGLALDTYHLNIEEKDPVAAIRRAGHAIRHVQVCGTDRGAVGRDHADWSGILDALDDADYAGPLAVESFTGENATIAIAASVWRPLEPSQDELARASLEFLEELQSARER